MKILKSFRPTRKNPTLQKGAALVGMIGVVVVMGVVGTSMISLSRSSEHSQLAANAGSRAHFLAESGLEYAQAIHRSEGWLHGRQKTLSLQGGEQVNVIRLEDTFWAQALVDAGSVKEGRARLPAAVEPSEGPGLGLGGGSNTGAGGAPSATDFLILGDRDFYVQSAMTAHGNIGMVNKDIDIYGDVEGDTVGDDIYVCTSKPLTGNFYSSGRVDISVGNVSGDVHADEGIILFTSNAIVNGWLFSNEFIYLGSGCHVHGHLHSCSGDIVLYGNSTVGTLDNPVEVRAHGDVIISGSAKIYGKVYAGGDISCSGTICGDAYAGGNISGTVTGETIAGAASFLEQPIPPDLRPLDGLELPSATSFSAYGNDVVIRRSSAVAVAPGTYCNLYTGRNARGACLYLRTGNNSHGNYYLNSVSLGSNMNLFLDLSGSHDIRIFVKNNIEVARDMNTYISTDGYYYYLSSHSSLDPELAKRVYWESHCDFVIGSNNWFGSVFTPYGYIYAESGSDLTGSYYSGGGVYLPGGTAKYQRSNYLSGN